MDDMIYSGDMVINYQSEKHDYSRDMTYSLSGSNYTYTGTFTYDCVTYTAE
jgi:hypothetical protein